MKALFVLLICTCAFAATAHGDIGGAFEIQVIYDDTNPPTDGMPYAGGFRLSAAESLVIQSPALSSARNPVTQLEDWSGAVFDTSDPDILLTPNSPVDLTFSAICNDAAAPIEFSYEIGGKRFTHTLPLLPPRPEPVDVIPPDVIVPLASTTRTSTIIAPTAEAQAELRESLARLTAESTTLNKAVNVNVQGRLIYHRGGDGIYDGAEGVTVRLYDQDSGLDDLLGVTVTDPNGVFHFTFPFGISEFAPDLYVHFEFANNKVEVEIPGWKNENYRYYGLLFPDYTGTDLDMGNMGFYGGASGRPVAHIANWFTRAADWLADRGFGNVKKVGVWYPDGDNAFYSPTYDNIHISFAKRWNEGTYFHEYGHHWLSQFADYDGTDYCNPGGYGDKPGDCGHWSWCPESSVDAWREGFPNWFSDAIGRTFAGQYSPAFSNPYDFEEIEKCDFEGADFYGDPYKTEGFIAALLRDIEDGTDIADSHWYTPGWGDAMDRSTNTILNFVDIYKPKTPLSFINFFVLANQGQSWFVPADFWETCANNGYDLADTNPPGVTPSVSSSSHAIGVPDPANKVVIHWTDAPDDFSGVTQYAVLLTPNPSELPPPTQFVTGNSRTFFNTAPGTYYAHVRARDRAGNWSGSFTSYGPLIVDEPTPPDLNVVSAPLGWADSLVPSDALSTEGSVQIDPVLINQSQGPTYFNLNIANSGMQVAPALWPTRLYLDGVEIASWSTGRNETIGGLSRKKLVNWNATWVRGGRHYLSAITDPDEDFGEEHEDDNYIGQQWVWNAEVMQSNGVPVQRIAPPDKLGGVEEGTTIPLFFPVNCDGLRVLQNTIGYTAVFIRPQNATDDYDPRLHPAAGGSQAGFDVPGVVTTGGWSSRGPGQVDAVLMQELTSDIRLWDVGVINENDGTGDYFVSHVVATGMPFASDVPVTLGINQYHELLQIDAPRGGDGAVQITVTAPPGAGPIHAALFAPEFVTGDLEDDAASGVTDANGNLTLVASSSSSSGQWGLAIWRDPADQPGARATGDELPAVTVTVNAGAVPANLTSLSPSGWFAPVVPRPLADGTPTAVALPESLVGNQPSTYVSSAWENDGSTTIPLAVVEIEVDGVLRDQLGFGPVDGGDSRSWNSPVGLNVRGGRHTVGMRLDPGALVPEVSELDNVWARQWVWRPEVQVPGPFATFPTPDLAAAGSADVVASGEVFGGYNTDGHRTPLPNPPADGTWWQVGAVLPEAGADVDLTLFERSFSPITGFRDPRARSARGPDVLDYVAVSHRATPRRGFDLGVTNLGSAPGGYTLQTVLSVDLANAGAGSFGPFPVGSNEIVDVVELELEAGFAILRVQDVGPDAVDWGLAVHRSDFAYHDPLTTIPGGEAWAAGVGEPEIVTVDVPVPGRYGIIVYKARSSERDKNGAYELELVTGFTANDPLPSAGAGSRITSVQPNPFNPRTEIRFAIDLPQRVRLGVYNVRGAAIRRLVTAPLDAGEHSVVWDGMDDAGRRAASGVYFLRLAGRGFEDRRKVTLVK